jgi:DNA-binding winged helix-turn-helix (wHTH) protein
VERGKCARNASSDALRYHRNRATVVGIAGVNVLAFSPFRVDLADERVWKNEAELRIRRKPFAILKHFVQNPRRLVTNEELVAAVWGKLAISESLVRTHVRDLRQALDEDIIETVVGRGYRFLADVSEAGREPATARAPDPSEAIVARSAELGVLEAALTDARDGQRAVVLVTGDPGMGKTSLVDAFVRGAREGSSAPSVARGTCVEQYGSGEAFLPMLEALASLCRGRGGEHVFDVLMRHAPTWLAQMPGLVPPARFEELQRRVAGTAQARMLREIVEALETLGTESPVVLVLDDLQWSDPSTLDVVAMLARRREPAHILVIGTYRSTELPPGSPLARVADELVAHRQATCVALEPFHEDDVGAYLDRRFPNHSFPRKLRGTIHRTTGGNPLFVVRIVEDLAARGMIAETDDGWTLAIPVERVAAQRPDGILRLIDTQIDRLGAAEQRILEAASLAGSTFTADAIAQALDAAVDEIDVACETLAEDRRLLRVLDDETWPNGTIHTRYGFAHALVQDTALARIPSASARVWRRRIAERLEAAHAGCLDGLAGELAVHFGEARAFDKAVSYAVMAGEREARRHAHREAHAHFARAQAMFGRLSPDVETKRLEYRIASGLARCLFATHGLTSSDVLPRIERSIELAADLGDDVCFASSLLELRKYHIMNGDFRASAALDDRLTAATERLEVSTLRAASSALAAATDLHLGRLQEAVDHLSEARAVADARGVEDLEVAILTKPTGALVSWLDGRPDDALAESGHGVDAAEAIGDPFWLGNALCAQACVRVWCGDVDGAESSARRAIDLANEFGLPWMTERAQPILLWVRAERDPTAGAEMNGWLARPGAGRMGRTLQSAIFALACQKVGRSELAREEIGLALAIAEESGECFVEAELHRLHGEILAATNALEADRCFARAIDVARAQGAVALELRARLSVHRHAVGAKKREAREDIARLVDRHGGDAATRDLRDAAAAVAG